MKQKPKETVPASRAYERLVSEIARLYQGARETLVRAYWEIGRRIIEVELKGEVRAPYGKGLMNALSSDLTRLCGQGFSVTNLQRMRLFYLANPKYATSPKLTWSQQLQIHRVRDPKKRALLERKAVREGLTSREIRRLVRAEANGKIRRRTALPAPVTASKLLTPVKGELFTYLIIEDSGALALDRGFAKYWNLSAREAKRFSPGDIVSRFPDGSLKKIKGAAKTLLYTYEAEVIRVVDGDTIWMKIYLEGRSRPSWVKEKLRLRDLDAPEINTPEGRAAKKFVETQIAGRTVTISTAKPDKWDRYLSDIFLSTPAGEVLYLNNLLLENGHAHIKTRWSLADWES